MSNEPLKLDSYDRRILFELDKNARISTTTIGKKIRKSKQFVDYRIGNLEKKGVLSKYVSVIDYSKLGYQSIRIYFKFHNITPSEQAKLEDDLIKDKEVWWLVGIQGPWDLAYAMAVKHILDFYTYWDRIIEKYRKYIQDHLVVIYTHIEQYPKAYLINQKNTDKGTLVGASREVVSLKKFDLRLLKLLSDNARMPLLELARRLGTSPAVIKKHMKDFEHTGIIQGYRAFIDLSSLGYRYYKAYINLSSMHRIAELKQFCFEHPNIVAINRAIAFTDFEIEFQARTFEEFDSYLGEIRERFKGMIDNYKFIIAREEKKMVYFPFE